MEMSYPKIITRKSRDDMETQAARPGRGCPEA